MGVFGAMVDEAFDDPDSGSARATVVAAEKLGRDDADVIVLYRSRTATVDDPAYQKAVTDTIAALPGDLVQTSMTYWSTGAPQFVSALIRSPNGTRARGRPRVPGPAGCAGRSPGAHRLSP